MKHFHIGRKWVTSQESPADQLRASWKLQSDLQTSWKGQSMKQKPFLKNYFHEILDVLWDKCVDYSGNYRAPKRTWWWKEIYEMGGKIIFQCFCFLLRNFELYCKLLQSPNKLYDPLQNDCICQGILHSLTEHFHSLAKLLHLPRNFTISRRTTTFTQETIRSLAKL